MKTIAALDVGGSMLGRVDGPLDVEGRGGLGYCGDIRTGGWDHDVGAPLVLYVSVSLRGVIVRALGCLSRPHDGQCFGSFHVPQGANRFYDGQGFPSINATRSKRPAAMAARIALSFASSSDVGGTSGDFEGLGSITLDGGEVLDSSID